MSDAIEQLAFRIGEHIGRGIAARLQQPVEYVPVQIGRGTYCRCESSAAKVRGFMRARPLGIFFTAEHVAARLRLPKQAVVIALGRMYRDGLLERDGRGFYGRAA